MAGYVKRVSYPEKGGNAVFCSHCNGYKHKTGCALYEARDGAQDARDVDGCALGGACSGNLRDGARDAALDVFERNAKSDQAIVRNNEEFREERRKQAQSAVTPVSKTAKRKVRVSALTPEAAANAVKTPEEERAVMGRGAAAKD